MLWLIMAHMREPNGVDILAEVAGMSPRSFARSFKQQTKVTPAAFVERARIDAARNRLEGSDLSLKVVRHQRAQKATSVRKKDAACGVA